MYNVTSVKEAGAIVAALEDIKDAMEGGYPEPTSATDGQVLTADGEGGASWENPQGGLPSTAYRSEDDVLSLDNNLNPIWRAPDVPTIYSSDNGKVLMAQFDDKSGTFAYWGTPSSGLSNVTYSVDATDFTKEGTSYVGVFDSQGDFNYSVADIVSARIYYGGAFSVPCSIYYIDKTGWAVAVTADDYRVMGSQSGLTLKICLSN